MYLTGSLELIVSYFFEDEEFGVDRKLIDIAIEHCGTLLNTGTNFQNGLHYLHFSFESLAHWEKFKYEVESLFSKDPSFAGTKTRFRVDEHSSSKSLIFNFAWSE